MCNPIMGNPIMGNPIIGKTNPLVHNLQVRVDFEEKTLSFTERNKGAWQTFRIPEHLNRLNAYLSDFFKVPAILQQNKQGREPPLPEWSHLKEFGNHYYLTGDCLFPTSEVGKMLNVVDMLVFVSEPELPSITP